MNFISFIYYVSFFLALLFSVNSFRILNENTVKTKLLEDKYSQITGNFTENDGAFAPIDSGKYIFKGCNFYNNIGQNDEPGAIYAKNSVDIIINDCTFRSNFGTRMGGAIKAENEFLSINNSFFYDNICNNSEVSAIAFSMGGAIFFSKSKGSQVISSCIFDRNKAKSSGGAIYIEYRTTHSGEPSYEEYVNITDCKFTECVSGNTGGAISTGFTLSSGSINDGDMSIDGCSFTKCSSTIGGAVEFPDGTPIRDEQKYILNCLFENNFATQAGSCLHSLTYELTIDNVTFKYNKLYNSSTLSTTFIYIKMNEKVPTIQNVIFEDNSGSAFEIILESGTLLFTDCTFKDYKYGSVFQSSLLTSKTEINFVNCLFTSCLGDGTTFPVDLSSNNFIFDHCNFSYNTKGAIKISGNPKLLFDYCDFEYNEIDTCGSAINILTSSEVIKINNSNFHHNSAKEMGGAIYGTGNAQISITKTIFEENRAKLDGGALYLSIQNFFIEECDFNNNEALNPIGSGSRDISNGGSIYLKIIAQSSISSCNFRSGRAKTSGGALFVEYDESGKDSLFTISDCNFNNCSCDSQGGALSSGYYDGHHGTSDGNMMIKNCTFDGCKAEYGGALYFNDGTTTNKEKKWVIECTFTNCSVISKDGVGYAIYCKSYEVNLTLNSFNEFKRFSNSYSPESQTIIYIYMNEEEVTPVIDYLSFEDIEGITSIYLDVSNSVTMSNLSYSNIRGSVPCIDLNDCKVEESLMIKQSNFSNVNNARCIWMTNVKEKFTTILFECQFIDNKATDVGDIKRQGSGASIFCQNNAKIELRQCKFINNHAENNGGAIFAETNAIEINTCKFYDCSAAQDSDGKGGAIYLHQSKEETELCSFNIFVNCSAGYSGGAIFVFCRDIEPIDSILLDSDEENALLEIVIQESTFENCRSNVEGGAISSGIIEANKKEGDNDMSILKCHFIRCESAKGGALYFQDGTKEGDEETKIERCYFYDCYATSEENEGYAIYCRSYKMSIQDCEFRDHIRGSAGKSCIVYIETNEADVAPNIKSLIFENNSYVSCLAVHSENKAIEISDIHFINITGDMECHACLNLDNWRNKGGVTFTECTFNNITECRCIFSSKKTESKYIKIKNCIFNDTKTIDERGSPGIIGRGASIFCKDKAKIDITECNFTNNKAANDGGAIHAESGSIDIEKCFFINCESTTKTEDGKEGGRGGAIYMHETENFYEEFISGNTFINCSAGYSGGGIFIYCLDSLHSLRSMDVHVVVEKCHFTDCKSNIEGGAVSSGERNPYNHDEMLGDNDMEIRECYFTRCESGKGGALYFQDGTKEGDEETKIERCYFYDCYATSEENEGYAIYCRSYKMSIQDCEFRDHHIRGSTGKSCIVYIETNEADVAPNIKSLIFENNSYVSCLTVRSKNKQIEITNLQFNNIVGDIDEHACLNLDNWRNEGGVTFRECTFSNIKECRCIFSSNKTESSFVKIEDCIFNDTKITIMQGSRGRGASIFCKNEAKINIIKCNFTNNEAEQDGGAIHTESGSVDISSCFFINCVSIVKTVGENEGGSGGAIYMQQTENDYDEFITGNTFINCSAGHSGGGMFIYCRDSHHTAREFENPIRIEQCYFTDCKSNIEGGAVSSGERNPYNHDEMLGDNDMEIKQCYFTRCESGKGGALYFQDGTKEGDEETKIERCYFYDCYATSEENEGYAIYCRSYKMSIQDCEFRDHIRGSAGKSCIVYIETNEADVAPNIKSLIFENNSYVSCLAVHSENKAIEISDIHFINITGNMECHACLNLDNWRNKGGVTFTECTFNNITECRCIFSSKKTESKYIKIKNCIFNDTKTIDDRGSPGIIGRGASIFCKDKAKIDITECNFTNNKAINDGGAIHAESGSIDIEKCFFINCESTTKTEDGKEGGRGGAIYMHETENFYEEFISGNTFINCSAGYSGGGIFIYCLDSLHSLRSMDVHVVVEKCHFTDCKSNIEGGAVSSGERNPYNHDEMLGDNDMEIRECYFTRCESGKGGALYFQDGTKEGDEETKIERCYFYDCYATSEENEGYAIYCRSYKMSIQDCEFRDHIRGSTGKSCIVYIETNEADVAPNIKSLIFENNSYVSCLTVRSENKQIEITNLQFNNIVGGIDEHACLNLDNWRNKGGVTFRECTFSNIKECRCIFSSNKTESSFVKIEDCIFNDTKITIIRGLRGRGASIFCKNEAKINIIKCNFTNNEAEQDGGAIHTESGSVDISSCFFINCVSIVKTVGENEGGSGGAIYMQQTENDYDEFITGNTFINCSAGHSGGGMFIYCRDSHHTAREFENPIRIEQCYFTDCKSNIEGGAVSSGERNPYNHDEMLGDNDMEIKQCYFTRCESGKGGALYFQDGTKEGDEETKIERCYFYDCYATSEENEGYAIYCRSYKMSIQDCEFRDHIRGSAGKSCIVYIETNEADVAPNIKSLIFENNSYVSCLAVHSENKAIEISDIHFINITGNMECHACLNLDNWRNKGGVTFTECTFNNITECRCIFSSKKTESKYIKIKNCIFNDTKTIDDRGSPGIIGRGASIFCKDKAKIDITECNFTNNKAINDGGAIHAESGSIDIEKCFFINCESTTKTEDGKEGGRGGAIYMHETENFYEEFISGNTFINCSAGYSGGGIFIYCLDSLHSLRSMDVHVVVEKCHFTDCKSNIEGGAVSSGERNPYNHDEMLGDNDMEIRECYFTRCESGKGGALYFQDGTKEGDEETKIERCYFYDCYATSEENEGYAIYCRSYKMSIQDCEFRDHIRGSTGKSCIVYIETNEADVAPNIKSLIFENNSYVSCLTVRSENKQIEITNLQFNNIVGGIDEHACLNLDNWRNKGGVTFRECTFSNIKECRCIFSSNKTESSFVKIEDCIFNDTKITIIRGLRGRGASIFCKNEAKINIIKCNFTNNEAEQDGGAIHTESGSVDISSCFFINCVSIVKTVGENEGGSGGAIYMQQTENDYDEFITGNTFINCSAGHSGGGMFIYCRDSHHTAREFENPIRIEQCYFTDCKSNIEGGAVSSGERNPYNHDEMLGDNDMEIKQCYFTRCESGKGGALYFQDGTKEGDEETKIESCYFYDCYATSEENEGYAIYCRSYKMNIKNCEFHNHKSKDALFKGNILYIQTNEADIKPNLQGLKFYDNTNISPMLVLSRQPIILSSSLFNSSPFIIPNSWTTHITFLSCLFENNLCENGGSLSISNEQQNTKNSKGLNDQIVILDNCQFFNNIGKLGGSIYANNCKQLIINSCSFYNSSATENGGSIYSSVYTEINNCNIINSSAALKGSNIYIFLKENVKISNITIDFEKKPGISAIFITGGDNLKELSIDGSGCFVSTGRNSNDNTPDFIESDSPGSIKLQGDMCFSETKQNSIKLPSSTIINENWFSCNNCSNPISLPTLTFSQGIDTLTPAPLTQTPISRTPISQPPITETISSPIINWSFSMSPTNEGNTTSKSSKSTKLSVGAIAGIVVGIVVFILLIVLLILLLLHKKSKATQNTNEVSQEVDSNVFSNDNENPIWSNDFGSNDKPMYSPSVDNPNFECPISEDPFVKEFEEGF